MGRRRIQPRKRPSSPPSPPFMATCERCGALFSSGLVRAYWPLHVTSPTQVVTEWASTVPVPPGECPGCRHVNGTAYRPINTSTASWIR
jgi:hypothetical protein